jgi:hypothetical protein
VYIYLNNIEVSKFYRSHNYSITVPSSAFFRKVILLFAILLCNFFLVQGTHLRAGQITTTQNGLTVTILIEVWTNNKSQVLFGGDQDVLDFGDGIYMLVPETRNQAGKPGSPPLPEGVSYASFKITHTYAAPGDYTISYREPNRNEGVLNMDSSVSTTFYLETKIVIDPFFGNNFSPYLAVDPIDKAATGVAFTHNPGAYDPNPQDSISYSMQIPYSDRNTTVVNYKDPNDPKFYTALNYNTANEAQTGPPTFSINPVTGTITWDAPGAQGEYNIAFHVIEWRKINGIWRRLGYVRRDMQIIVEDSDNDRPELEIPPDTCIVAGTKLEATIIGKDENGDKIKIEAFSPIFNVFTPPAKITPNPGPNDYRDQPASTLFEWQTNCTEVRDQPYAVVFKVTDDPPQAVQLATFKTWFITVVGPAPLWVSDVEGVGYTRNETKRTVNLTWQDYTCTNAVTMQVWRKVDGVDFTPSNCETGMPPYLGYELVGTVPIGTTSYTDTNNGKGLTPGAKYCYRLVAVFAPNTGSESLVSQDLCIEPFKITTPVITNVSVLETAGTQGKIEIKWIAPIEHPTYPADYTYRIYRNPGFVRTTDSTLVGETKDLVFTDQSADLNTEATVYNYSVAAFLVEDMIGVSTVASSVRLEARSRLNRIELEWNAVVPWSNSISGLTHKIYRGQVDTDPVTLEDLFPNGTPSPLAQIEVTNTGFVYVDTEGLEQKKYCYVVETYGSYGSDKIPSPLINRSQIVCAEPGEEVPPCKPTALFVENENCKSGPTGSACRPNDFTNKLAWQREDLECNEDIDYYQVYYANSATGEYVLIADKIRDTFYEDKGINRTSFAACYRIAAVDRSQNISELSDPVCVENCPYYELPNVFTPNGDGCNDFFSAYSDRDVVGETPSPDQCVTTPESKQKCARFVEQVVFTVFNRWGKEVYSYVGESTDDENNIWIDWDGKSNEGKPLSTGVYYYIAEVTFVAIDPALKNQTFKGSIHLIRGPEN